MTRRLGRGVVGGQPSTTKRDLVGMRGVMETGAAGRNLLSHHGGGRRN